MGVDTLGGAFNNILWFLGDVAFTWVPATVGSITGTAPGSSPPISLLSQPVTVPQVLSYLQATPATYSPFAHDWEILVAISILLSILFAALIIYSALGLARVREHEQEYFEIAAHPVAAHDIPLMHLRWERLMEEAYSGDENRWRLAILEADIMLNELLDTLGYRGETMADKMKQVDRMNFHSIDAAWEAHRVRNEIVHDGSARLLTAGETHHVMRLYEQVFREFKVIE